MKRNSWKSFKSTPMTRSQTQRKVRKKMMFWSSLISSLCLHKLMKQFRLFCCVVQWLESGVAGQSSRCHKAILWLYSQTWCVAPIPYRQCSIIILCNYLGNIICQISCTTRKFIISCSEWHNELFIHSGRTHQLVPLNRRKFDLMETERSWRTSLRNHKFFDWCCLDFFLATCLKMLK